jgi:transcriptional regulator with XRE-family HTH domain
VQQSTIRFLSARLKALREIARLTQEEVAELAGLTYKHYQSIEAGRKQEIWLSTAERLAKAFGVGVWELLAPTIPKPRVRKRTNSSGKAAGK